MKKAALKNIQWDYGGKQCLVQYLYVLHTYVKMQAFFLSAPYMYALFYLGTTLHFTSTIFMYTVEDYLKKNNSRLFFY